MSTYLNIDSIHDSSITKAKLDVSLQNSLNLADSAEQKENKKTSLSENSDTYYPSQKAVKTYVDTANLWETGTGTYSVKTKNTGTTASGAYSFAEGLNTIASGSASHAEGDSTQALEYVGHAEGAGTIAANSYEHAEGLFNKSNVGTIHSVGIGESSTNRKNAFEIFSNGTAYLYGLGTYNGTNPIYETNDIKTIINNKADKDGSNASGTWGINISGTAEQLSGYQKTYFVNYLGDSSSYKKSNYYEGYIQHYNNDAGSGEDNPHSIIGGNQSTVLQVIPNNSTWGGQYAFGFSNPTIAFRSKQNSSTWSDWQKINAGSADKLSTDTAGNSHQPCYFSGGKPYAITRMYDEYLKFGNDDSPSVSGELSPIGMALSSEHNANRLAFIDGSALKFEYSSDGGSTWTEYEENNMAKTQFCTTSYGFAIGRSNSESSTAYTTNSRTRITLTADLSTQFYTDPKKLLINVGVSGTLYVNIETRTGANYKSGGAWDTYGIYNLQGWTGWNEIPLLLNTLGAFNIDQTTNIWQLRLTFLITATSTYSPDYASIYGIRLFGVNSWKIPSTLANTGHIYDFDIYKNVYFPNAIKSYSTIYADGFHLINSSGSNTNIKLYPDSSSTEILHINNDGSSQIIVRGVKDPTSNYDAANKGYVDEQIAEKLGNIETLLAAI